MKNILFKIILSLCITVSLHAELITSLEQNRNDNIAIELQVPNEEQQVKLFTKSVDIFMKNIKVQNMKSFVLHISRKWQKKITATLLEKKFLSFYSQLELLNNFMQSEVDFIERHTLYEDKKLILEGYYHYGHQELKFEHYYIYEKNKWKLISFDIAIVG